jgi:alpha-1,3-glucosyltransferase
MRSSNPAVSLSLRRPFHRPRTVLMVISSVSPAADSTLSDSYLEIVAPVPRRHRALQPSPDVWILTPSPSSSRAISPQLAGGSVGRERYRYTSFSAVMEAEKETPLQEQGFGRRWLRWLHKNGVKDLAVPCTLLASILVRLCVGLGSYSGEFSKPPPKPRRGLPCALCMTLSQPLRTGSSPFVWRL